MLLFAGMKGPASGIKRLNSSFNSCHVIEMGCIDLHGWIDLGHARRPMALYRCYCPHGVINY